MGTRQFPHWVRIQNSDRYSPIHYSPKRQSDGDIIPTSLRTYQRLDIIYFDFTGQLVSPRIVVVFNFRLNPFGLRLGKYLGLRLSLIGHVYFQLLYFVAFWFSPTS